MVREISYCSVCCYPAVAAAAVLLLAAAGHQRLPGDTNSCCGLSHIISVFLSPHHINFDVPGMYVLTALAHVQPRLCVILRT